MDTLASLFKAPFATSVCHTKPGCKGSGRGGRGRAEIHCQIGRGGEERRRAAVGEERA